MRTPHIPGLALIGLLIPIAACADVATAPAPSAIAHPQLARATRSITMTTLGSLGGDGSGEALGINSAGSVVGYSRTATGDWHAFLWKEGGMTDLGTLGGRVSFAFDINEAGEVVGYAATSSGEYHAFLWRDGVMTDLSDAAGYQFYTAAGISSNGLIVGVASSTTGAATSAVLWERGHLGTLRGLSDGFATAEAINPRGDVVGLGANADGFNRAILWKRGEPIDLGTLGGRSAWALDINPAGVVVGLAETSQFLSHAFRWRAGKMTDLGTLGGWTSIANSINPAGQIAGGADATDDYTHAVVWQRDEILDLGTPGLYSTASGISASGQVVGSACTQVDSEGSCTPGPVMWSFR